MPQLRIGVIGAGGISHFHIDGILRSPDAVLTAVCDIDPEALARANERYGVAPEHCFTEHEALLRCESVDAVSICTPNAVHFPIAMDAVRLRKPFALEKPVTMDAEQAAALHKAAKDAGLPHMVCFSYRFKPAARYVRQLVRQGKLGRIRHVYAQYLQSWAIDEQLPLVWRFRKDQTGSGSLGDLGSHMLDLVRFIVDDIDQVCGSAETFVAERKLPGDAGSGPVDVDDCSTVLAKLIGGAQAQFSITRFAYGRGNYQRLEIYGDKGAAVYTLDDADTVEVCLDAQPGCAGRFVPVAVPESCRSDQIQSFIDIVNGCGDGLAAVMSDGLANQLALDAILKSIGTGRWTPVAMQEEAPC